MGTPAPVALVVHGPLRRGDLDGLSLRICALLSHAPGRVVHCRVVGVDPDAVAVDALARLQVVARRNGCRVVLCDAAPDLLDLVAWMGLADVLPEQR